MSPWLLLSLLLFVGCSTVDLRPDHPITEEDRVAGREMLAQLAETHGGVEAWRETKMVRVEMSDRWKGFAHFVAGPWPRNGTPFELTFIPTEDDGRIRFLEANEPDWGIQNWATYKVKDGEARFRRDGDIEFWIPTATYFVEAPFRLVEATTVYRMPSARVDGKTYERVFATWGDDAPQDRVDQYVVWIDPDTSLVAWLQYTVRDYGKWMMGIMAYEDYVKVDGFTLAQTMGTVDEPGGKRTLHEFRVSNIELGVDVDRSYVVPDPARRDSKP